MNKQIYLLFSLAMGGLISFSGSAHSAVIASFDFEPNNVNGTQVDIDNSDQTNWITSVLQDNATGSAGRQDNQNSTTNRDFVDGSTANFLILSADRELDSGRPIGHIGNSTWFTFNITPSNGVFFDFVGQMASVDTYAVNNRGGGVVASGDWTLYYKGDKNLSFTSLGTFNGASATSRSFTQGPTTISWDLTPLGKQKGVIEFLLDPVYIGSSVGGDTSDRAIGFSELMVNANVVIPEPTSVMSIIGISVLGLISKKKSKR